MSPGATCNVGLVPATETVSVTAGSLIGFKLQQGTVYHKGPAAMYLGKAPGKADDWDGSGQNWFKIAEWGATFNPFNFVSLGQDTFTAAIPSSVPSGEYLVRIEQIALHLTGAPELFLSCAQIRITGGGSGSPTKVSIPGYILKDDPMLMLNIYWPVPTAFTVPGPSVYSDNQTPALPSQIVKQTGPQAVQSPTVSTSQTEQICHGRLGRRKSSLSVRHIRHRSH